MQNLADELNQLFDTHQFTASLLSSLSCASYALPNHVDLPQDTALLFPTHKNQDNQQRYDKYESFKNTHYRRDGKTNL